ncbi:hypothetical protein D9Q98_009829 [Chlorella vulgaris]|uniref:Uncharacterized protein n=1 Tax=Chlorella vulgaris TaxID=3077 RepID=A0A9D4YSG5_CHLVU|nr:hypothetical protein D9Q98_009829 [Chlorella vulgaris]
MPLACCLCLFRSHTPPAAPRSADGSPAGTNTALAHINPSHSSPASNSPGSGDRTELFQPPVEAPAVPHVAAASVPAETSLTQMEEEELDDNEAGFTRRGAVRSLGQYYAGLLGYRTMARLRAEVAVDDELRHRFEALLEEDGVDWRSWDAMTRWYDTKQYSYVQGHGQLGRPVGVPLDCFLKVNDAWFRRCCDSSLMTFSDFDESE